MIYYPLSVLMLAGIRDILIITTPEDQANFRRLLGTGEQFGVNLTYILQPTPDGLAQAYILGEDFVAGQPSALILGDNIFYGSGFSDVLAAASRPAYGATVFGYPVADPHRYGVVEFDADGKVLSLEEKPAEPRSNVAVTGLYFYDGRATEYARQLKPSARGELEITSLNAVYLEAGALNVELLGRGFTWLDTGTHDSLIQAGEFVRTIEQRQGLRIGCLEEIAFHNAWLDQEGLRRAAGDFKSPYADYLRALADGKF
jgi:glucose-1-phosphate thymidylyltransferase